MIESYPEMFIENLAQPIELYTVISYIDVD